MPPSTILPLASDSDAGFVQCLLEPVSRLKWLSLPIEMSDDWLGRRDVERPIEVEHPDLKLGPLNIKAPGETSSMFCKESWYPVLIVHGNQKHSNSLACAFGLEGHRMNRC